MQTITRITATIAATQAVAWPHFAGSTLRGAFGRALRRAACITGQEKCTGCPLRDTCAYGVVFDPAAPTQPLHPSFQDGLPRYVMQPPPLGAQQLRADHTQHFSLLLLPGTQTHHGLVTHILRNAVEKELFQPGLFKLVDTRTSQVPIPLHTLPQTPATMPAPPDQDNTSPTAASPAPTTTNARTDASTNAHISLRWHTPLRLQHLGKPVFKAQQLDAPGLVRALLRRQLQWLQITQNHANNATALAPHLPDPLSQAAACTLDTRHLLWHDLQRHSSTQNNKLPLGGLLGNATLSGPSAALHSLLPLLQLGEHLHLGKEIVMGLGRYQLSALTRD